MMPLFFFHVWKDGQVLMDDDGQQFESVSDALLEADASARELLAAAITADKNPPDLISVYDDHQQKVAEVSLRSLVPLSLR